MSDSTAYLLYGLTGLSVVVAVFAVVIAARANRVAREAKRDYMRIASADSDVVDTLLDRISGIDVSVKAVEKMAELLQATRDDLAHSLRHVAVVRYDAFRDLTGRLSFSVALLDDTGDGMIMTSLHGRSETQFFAKTITKASPEGLSPEEQQAVEHALTTK